MCLHFKQQFLNSERMPLLTCCCRHIPSNFSLIFSSGRQTITPRLLHLWARPFVMWSFWQAALANQLYNYYIAARGPFAMLTVFLYRHPRLWYTVCSRQPWGQLMNLASNQRTVISLRWLDGQVPQDEYLSGLGWWTLSDRTGISCQPSTSC